MPPFSSSDETILHFKFLIHTKTFKSMWWKKLISLGLNVANQKLKDPNFQRKVEKSIMENKLVRKGLRGVAEKKLDYKPPRGSTENPDAYAGKQLRKDFDSGVDKLSNISDKVPKVVKNFISKEKTSMVFYVIGLGLSDAKDVSCRGLEVIKNCKKVFLEAYTSVLLCPTAELEAFYGRTDLIEADRTMVEQQSEVILEHAKEADVAFLVVGDPLSATTHTDLILRAVEMEIPYRVLHNASIMNAIGCTGLQLYNFVFWEDNWKPTSYFDKILKNRKQGYHTLCLLDIKMKEQSNENLMRGNNVFEPPRWMTCQQCAVQFLEILEKPEYENCGITKDQLVIGVSKVGSEEQKIVSCSLEKMAEQNWLGAPLHSLVLPSEVIHDLEMDFVNTFNLKE